MIQSVNQKSLFDLGGFGMDQVLLTTQRDVGFTAFVLAINNDLSSENVLLLFWVFSCGVQQMKHPLTFSWVCLHKSK